MDHTQRFTETDLTLFSVERNRYAFLIQRYIWNGIDIFIFIHHKHGSK